MAPRFPFAPPSFLPPAKPLGFFRPASPLYPRPGVHCSPRAAPAVWAPPCTPAAREAPASGPSLACGPVPTPASAPSPARPPCWLFSPGPAFSASLGTPRLLSSVVPADTCSALSAQLVLPQKASRSARGLRVLWSAPCPSLIGRRHQTVSL